MQEHRLPSTEALIKYIVRYWSIFEKKPIITDIVTWYLQLQQDYHLKISRFVAVSRYRSNFGMFNGVVRVVVNSFKARVLGTRFIRLRVKLNDRHDVHCRCTYAKLLFTILYSCVFPMFIRHVVDVWFFTYVFFIIILPHVSTAPISGVFIIFLWFCTNVLISSRYRFCLVWRVYMTWIGDWAEGGTTGCHLKYLSCPSLSYS